MAYNGSGTFSPYTPGNPVVTGTTISSSVHNATISDLAAGLTNAMTRDGQSPATANIPMGNNKLTGLAAGTANGDAMRFEQTATSGANSNITSLLGLTTPLSVAQGGTGLAAAGPTFSAHANGSMGVIANVTFTKALFDAELWDTNANFASSRFTPTVAGYYQINAAYQTSSLAPMFVSIYKNGSEFKRGQWVSSGNNTTGVDVSGLVSCNGSTDYLEIYIYQASGGAISGAAGSVYGWFDGHFARGL